ncbi:tRNA (adenine(37)-N6)-methyltransferase [Diachasma alloeum]|uniref:tRNA (adenine(37)-N6)-methyltransferase n=1 Tax=Diachasma alloeum TaxID=454923 RepID=UPI00073811C7|nr:tRNA (adenine(37)-N6)-methyltransferase [Diachasma alloeum]
MMESVNRPGDEPVEPEFILGQLNIARREIHNLRQQIKSLRYIFEKDVNGIKRLIGLNSGASTPGDDLTPVEPTTSTSQPVDTSCVSMTPIGVINTGFPNKRATPRQSGIGRDMCGKITLFNTVFTNPEHALNGLQEFSHMWILFHFHRNESTHIRAKVAPPRLNGVRTGVFSTRSPHRPCPIGLSLVKILEIEDNTILFEGVDTVDGTPVLDIKPYIPQYDSPLHVEHVLKGETNGNPEEQLEESVEIMSEPPREDVSGDEELALRLQAEEFENSSTLESSPGALEAEYLLPQVDNPPGNDSSIPPGAGDEDPRNSRLLDGADGPSAVCGTDMDFLNRRMLNLRHDNSPVRMGVREAPDGEEGLESQALRPSQTVSNIQNIPAGASRVSTSSLQNLSEGAEALEQVDVRVPDWISQSGSRSLSVVFNERALRQLNEIVNDKTEEQKRAIENVLKEDPRSVYLRQRWANQFYTFLIHDLHISCRFDDSRGIVTVFQVRPAGRICDCGEPEWQCLGHSPVS